jgi:DNA repair protein RadC
MAGVKNPPGEPGGLAEGPHYIGHRDRLRTRFLEAGDDGMSDYELLELVLFRSMPRRDTKPVAKALISRFGTFAEVLGTRIERLKEVDGIGDSVAADLKIIEAAARRMAKGAIKKRPVLDHWRNVIDYCRTAMAFADREEFRILFLDRRNCLIADEIQGTGTIDHAPAYPREIVRRALEVGATAFILVHNHPSGDPSPSTADVRMTLEIASAAKLLGIELLDHIIVGRHGHASFKGMRLI